MTASDESLSEELLRLHDWLTTATTNGPVAVITGKNGDMDTIGSAVALAASHPNLMAAGLHVGRVAQRMICLLYTSPSPRDRTRSRMPSSA